MYHNFRNGTPQLRFATQPARRHRFRYVSEGTGHEKLNGISATGKVEPYPTVQIHPNGFEGDAQIKLELIYLENGNQKSHPNKLLLKVSEQRKELPKKEECIRVNVDKNNNFLVGLEGLEIFKATQNEVKEQITKNENQALNKDKVKEQAKSIADVVCLKCTLLSVDGVQYDTAISEPIRHAEPLVIDHAFQTVAGQIVLFTSKFKKDDVEIYFRKKNPSTGEFPNVCKGDIELVHAQTAVVLKIPECTYSDEPITDAAKLKVQLYRKCDDFWSDMKDITNESISGKKNASATRTASTATLSDEPRAKRRKPSPNSGTDGGQALQKCERNSGTENGLVPQQWQNDEPSSGKMPQNDEESNSQTILIDKAIVGQNSSGSHFNPESELIVPDVVQTSTQQYFQETLKIPPWPGELALNCDGLLTDDEPWKNLNNESKGLKIHAISNSTDPLLSSAALPSPSASSTSSSGNKLTELTGEDEDSVLESLVTCIERTSPNEGAQGPSPAYDIQRPSSADGIQRQLRDDDTQSGFNDDIDVATDDLFDDTKAKEFCRQN